jgi:Zn-dependent protease with chaperone function
LILIFLYDIWLKITTVINASFFDGKTSRLHHVQLRVDNGIAYVTGDVSREDAICDLHVSERTLYAARRVTFPDGAYLECTDHVGFNDMLRTTNFKDSIVVRWQHNWRAVAGFAVLIIALMVLSYLFILPTAAKVIANNLPASVDASIGTGTLDFLDKHFLKPSKLTAAQQEHIRTRFAELRSTQDSGGPVELVFRSSKGGANAFALPSRQIVLTDEIVTLLDNDEELMAVLGHELGHVVEHHFTRRLIQSSTVAAGATLLFGDVSNVIAGVPTMLLDLKYSRDTERDADDFAISFLKKNGISTDNLAHVFEKLQKQNKGGEEPIPYLSSHPLTQERLENIRKAGLAPDS